MQPLFLINGMGCMMVEFSEMEKHKESPGFLGGKIISSVLDMQNLRTFETSKRQC